MIRNDRQYRITKAQADEFEHALNALTATSTEAHPAIHKAQVEATRSQLEELQAELAVYDALRAGKPRVLELTSLDELPHALICARIASGMTQKDLADRLGLKEQQIQRYEATNYSSASLSRIVEVVKALGLSIREDVFLPRRRDLQQRRTPDDRRRDQGGPMKYLVTLGATPKTPRTKKKKNP